MNIAVVINKKIKDTEKIVKELKTTFENSGINCDVLDLDNLKSGYDFVCAVGGDGTILKASRFYAKVSTAVMGINYGRLGFLSPVALKEITKLGTVIKNKEYHIEERMMLKSGKYTALNDFVVKGHSNIRTSKFNLYINGELVSEYIADGIIVSTPTGSTAYGLSAGGPILHPDVNAMAIVPICAHTMTARPLVVPATDKIMIKTVDEMLDLSSDGQEKISGVEEVVIEQADYKAKLAVPCNDSFYTLLQSKLSWGLSPVSSDI